MERGHCCTAGWPIHIEPAEAALLDAALASGAVTTSRRPVIPLRPVAAADGRREYLLGHDAAGCVFHHDSGTHRCEIHRTLGHQALPLACRQFPRVTVRDPRGVSVTLSHYCPTAAALLTRAATIAIVQSPAAFPPGGEYVGLDATTFPPLLRPGMFMDWESWWEWERLSVTVLSAAPTAAGGLATLRAAVAHARTWTPGGGPLIDRVRRAFARAAREPAPIASFHPETLADAFDAAVLSPSLRAIGRRVGETDGNPADSVRRTFLAAHAFANWTAHLGGGLRSWLRSIEAADALITHFRADLSAADLLLRHLADPQVLADRWSAAEEEPD